MTADSFKVFSQLLVDFRAGRVDLNVLLDKLWELLPADRRDDVLVAFQPFVIASRRPQCTFDLPPSRPRSMPP